VILFKKTTLKKQDIMEFDIHNIRGRIEIIGNFTSDNTHKV